MVDPPKIQHVLSSKPVSGGVACVLLTSFLSSSLSMTSFSSEDINNEEDIWSMKLMSPDDNASIYHHYPNRNDAYSNNNNNHNTDANVIITEEEELETRLRSLHRSLLSDTDGQRQQGGTGIDVENHHAVEKVKTGKDVTNRAKGLSK